MGKRFEDMAADIGRPASPERDAAYHDLAARVSASSGSYAYENDLAPADSDQPPSRLSRSVSSLPGAEIGYVTEVR